MKYQIGDDIIVLHSHEEGKVVEIMNDKMVMIEVRGVKFPAYMDQIDFPYFYRFSKKKVVPEKKPVVKQFIDQLPKEKAKPNSIKVADGVWLSMIPKFDYDEFDDEFVTLFKLYLVNKSDTAFTFNYTQVMLGDTAFELKSEVLPFQDFYLHDVPFSDFSDSPHFNFVFSLLTPQKGKAPFFEAAVKFKGKQIFKLIEAMKAKNEPSISQKLFDDYPNAVEEEKFPLTGLAAAGFKVYEAKKIKQNLPPARTVIDLHMEKIMDNWQSLGNYEILQTQLQEFEKWYDLAVAHRQPTLTVIHGVGSGRLRDEIHELLKARREVRFFINQYDPRFGYGATEVFFNV